MSKIIIRLLPCFGAFAWALWYCVSSKWSEVIVPSFGWLVTVITIATLVLYWATKDKKQTTKGKALTERRQSESTTRTVLANEQPERLIAKEVCKWSVVTRIRSLYGVKKERNKVYAESE